MSKVIRLGIGVPAYGARVVAQQAEFWMTVGFALAASEKRFQLRSFGYLDTCGVDVARNRLVHEAMVKGCDWLFMIDADTWHEAPAGTAGADVLQMISDADRVENCAYVGSPVPFRGPDTLVYNAYERIPDLILDPAAYLGKETLTEVAGFGAAISAVNINFLREKEIKPPWFKFAWNDGTLTFVGEDLYFCQLVKKAGGKVMIDGRFVGKHLAKPKPIE